MKQPPAADMTAMKNKRATRVITQSSLDFDRWGKGIGAS
jgi:hypothetical protein